MGHGVVGAIHHKAFDLSDLTVDGVHVRVPPHFGLAHGDGVADHEGRAASASEVAVLDQLHLLGWIKAAELGQGAAEHDVARHHVDKLNWHETADPLLLPGFDDQVGDRPGGRVDDRAADHAAESVGAASLRSQGELHPRDCLPLVAVMTSQPGRRRHHPPRMTVLGSRPQVGQHCEDPPVVGVGWRQAQLAEDVADVLLHRAV